MQLHQDRIEARFNFQAKCYERGKYVPGTVRDGHNVFTTVGRDWLARLSAWQTVGGPDVPYTNRRLRWIGVGTGSTAEVPGVTQLVAPALSSAGIYLSPIQVSSFPVPTTVEVYKEFGTGEISLPALALPIVAVTEAGLFVDVQPASTSSGVDDAAGGGPTDTTLDISVGTNAPVAYKTFEPINKTIDFSLIIRWQLIF